jgi:integrase
VETIVINAFLRNELANKRLSDLTPEGFARYRDQRLKLVRAATISRELGLVQRILEVAKIEWSVPLGDNPIKAIRKPKADKARERRLQNNEWERLIEASRRSRNSLLLPLAKLALATGMRRGELLNARWGDINWLASTLHIPHTKTGEPRTIPLSEQAKRVLATLAIDWSEDAKIVPLSAEAAKLGWARLTRRAKINNLTFHDLRHEAVSRFFEQGLTVPEVALISGHRDPRMLFRYTHLKAEDVAHKLNSIDGRETQRRTVQAK